MLREIPPPLTPGDKVDDDDKEVVEARRKTSGHHVQHMAYAQGDVVQFLAAGYFHFPPNANMRKGVMDFSPAARLRLLKFAAKVNWEATGRSQFATLGYPDECWPRSREQLNRDRYLLHREIENAVGRKVAVLWRIEWIDRKSGKHIGELLPHWHMIFFSIGHFPYKRIRQAWKRIIRASQEPNIKFQKLQSARQHGFYIAKYSAKKALATNLGNVTYHNTQGRHYGFLRKSIIPMEPKVWFEPLSREEYRKIQEELYRELGIELHSRITGFTVLGERATKITARLTA